MDEHVKKLGNITIDDMSDRDEFKRYDFDNEIDPDMHYYSNLDINCNYYTEQEFNKSVKMYGALSIIHFNSRSLCKNYSAIKEFLKSLKKFTIIAISETWLDDGKVGNVGLEGYELYTTNRNNKKGRGVALYIDKSLRSKIVKNVSYSIDNVLDCVTVEIEVEHLET